MQSMRFSRRRRATHTRLLILLSALVAMSVGFIEPVRGQEAPAPGKVSGGLLAAIRDGDAARIAALLDEGEDVNGRDAEGNTPLILAAFYGSPDGMELLLKKGADPNAANAAGVTPLIRAATDAKKVRLLLTAGANVNARSRLGNTPLILAARRSSNSATVKLLLERGADPRARNEGGASPILAAAAGGDPESVRLLLDKGADPNDFPGTLKGHPFQAGARTPLMWAAFHNNVPMLRLLLERHADPNKSVAFGTPLSHAAWRNSLEAAQVLLDHGARVDSRDSIANFTPLHWAAASESPRPDLVTLLLSRGGDPNAEGGDPIDSFMTVPQTPLMLASRRGDTPILRALVAAGAVPSEPSPPRPVRLRPLPEELNQNLLRRAAERALVPLQLTAAKSPAVFLRHASNQECVSCHQQYLPMAAVGLARERSLRIDLKALQDQIRLFVRLSHTCRDPFFLTEYHSEAVFHPEPAGSIGYELFGMDLAGVGPSEASNAMIHHLATIQAEDGRWDMNLPRPPIQSGDVGTTALAIRALRHHGWPARKAEFDACVDRGRRWLWSVRPETNEEAIFQLLGLHWAGEPADKLSDMARSLIGRQREDGGWPQLPTLLSDAYATGESLYALSLAAGRPISDAAWNKGLRFLLGTQQDDGTWRTVRRAIPFQPTMSSGFPYGRDSWVSTAATSWAVIALTRAIEPGTLSSAVSSPIAAPAPEVLRGGSSVGAVDFTTQIKPILERSCLSCHGPNRSRSHYRLDSRDALIKGGDSGDPAVVPGHSEVSPIIRYVSGSDSNLEMPPVQKRNWFPALTPHEVELLAAWVDQNAPWPDGTRLAADKE